MGILGENRKYLKPPMALTQLGINSSHLQWRKSLYIGYIKPLRTWVETTQFFSSNPWFIWKKWWLPLEMVHTLSNQPHIHHLEINLPVASITRAVASRSLWSSRPSWFQPPGHWPSEFPHLVARAWLDTALKLTAGYPKWWFCLGKRCFRLWIWAIFGIYLKFLAGMVWLKHGSEILLTSWGWWFIPRFTGLF